MTRLLVSPHNLVFVTSPTSLGLILPLSPHQVVDAMAPRQTASLPLEADEHLMRLLQPTMHYQQFRAIGPLLQHWQGPTEEATP